MGGRRERGKKRRRKERQKGTSIAFTQRIYEFSFSLNEIKKLRMSAKRKYAPIRKGGKAKIYKPVYVGRKASLKGRRETLHVQVWSGIIAY